MNTIHEIFTALATGVVAIPDVNYFSNDSCSMMFNCNDDEAKVKMIVDDFRNKTNIINQLTIGANQLYYNLISMNSDKALNMVMQSDPAKYEHSEIFIRAFEFAVKKTAEEHQGNKRLHKEIISYWKCIAKARSEITRLNHLVKQLTTVPETFESNMNFQSLRELAEYSTDKVADKKNDLI